MSSRDFLYGVRMLIPNYEFNPVKVGFSSNIRLRQQSYNSGPFPVEWLGEWPAKNGKADEAAIHDLFKSDRLSGEWFTPNPDLLDLISQNVKAYKDALEKSDAGFYGQWAKRGRTANSRARYREQAHEEAYLECQVKLKIQKMRDNPCRSCREKLLLESLTCPPNLAKDLKERLEAYLVGRTCWILEEDETASILDIPIEKVIEWRTVGLIRRSNIHRRPTYGIHMLLETFGRWAEG